MEIESELLKKLTPAERRDLDDLLRNRAIWSPQKGPQQIAFDSKADVIGYGGAAGGGKGLALDTLLATPSGWTTIGEVEPGDVLFDECGRPCTVLAVSDVQYRDCYRITFDDGTSLVADDVHRWVTFDAKELSALTRKDPEWRARRRAKRPSRAQPTTSPVVLAALARLNARDTASAPPSGEVRDTALISQTLLTAKGRRNHAVRVAAPLVCDEASLLVPPYVLGAWLGDGSSRNGQLTGQDAYIWERIAAEGFGIRHYDWSDQAHNILGLASKLKSLGLLQNKRIPDPYLRAGYDQRLALLQGLMDTDGHAAIDGGCEFDSTSEVLAQGVRHLATTLGIKATLQRGVAKLRGRLIGPKWRVKFTTSVPVFGMPRKADRLKPATRRTGSFRYIVACDKIPSVPTKCIAVDSPTRQFLAGESLVPTHNTDVIIGKALLQHKKTLILRREATQLTGIVDRISELLGSRDGYNGSEKIWRLSRGKQIEFGSTPLPDDWTRYAGRPHDLLAFDEAAGFLESQVRALMGWVRSSDQAVHCQTIMAFNPPTSPEGRWVVPFFAPWLDKKHPNPAMPGELRYFAMLGGEEREVPTGDLIGYMGIKIKPLSRTFIPSRVTDNAHLMKTGYMATLQALPAVLRAQMLYGDFDAGTEDDPWQVIPTAWAEEAMQRWTKPAKLEAMDSMGVDVARGGRDQTIFARRHGMWFDEPVELEGSETPNGPAVAGQVIAFLRDNAVVHVDVIGVGSSPYDFLQDLNIQSVGVNVSESARGADKSGRLRFANYRSELWWRMREALDPANNTGICLPPNRKLLSDLTAVTWKLSGSTIIVASRDELVKRLGRSPDHGSAYVLALIDTPKTSALMELFSRAGVAERKGREYDPYKNILRH